MKVFKKAEGEINVIVFASFHIALGAGESGKSTIVKQMKWVYTKLLFYLHKNMRILQDESLKMKF